MKNVVYPNPVKNTLFMQLTGDQNRIFITDVLGHKLLDSNVPSNYSLDMSSFETGIYFLRVENTYGVEHQKIIKK